MFKEKSKHTNLYLGACHTKVGVEVTEVVEGHHATFPEVVSSTSYSSSDEKDSINIYSSLTENKLIKYNTMVKLH